MSRSAGTGYPIRVRCASCRRGSDSRRGLSLARTGRTRPLRGRARSVGHCRALDRSVEYRCLDCGHVGWTRLRQILDAPVAEAEERGAET